jgi:Flp pilus assembly protein TadD
MAPNSPDIADTFGWLLLKSGNAKGAVPVLQKAHAIGPDNGEISYHLALALNAMGKKAEARSALQAALAKNSNFKSAAEARKLLQTLPK